MNINEATTILSRFIHEDAAKVLPQEKSAPLLEAWALVEPELPDENRIHNSWHTFFKSVGVAIQDLCATVRALANACQLGLETLLLS